MSDIGWLIEQAEPQPVVVDMLTELDAADIRGSISCSELHPELWLYLSDLEVVSPCTLEPHGDLPGTWIDIHFLARGEALLETTDGARGRLDPRNGLVFRLPERRARFHLPTPSGVRSVGVAVSVEKLAALLGDDTPPALAPLMEDDLDGGAVLPFRVGTPLRRLAASFFGARPPQVLRRLFLEAQALQFIALALSELPSDGPTPAGRALSTREAALVAEAKVRLEANLREPPTITALAAALGLSASRLAEGFRALYGTTAFEIVRNARLDHARIALETTEMPLKVLAYRVGYSDVTNFIHAFRGRFGCPPGRYAKARSVAAGASAGPRAAPAATRSSRRLTQ